MQNNPQTETSDNSVTIGEDLATQIRGEICRGRYQAGDRLLPERELAARYDVNRSSVREALQILQKEGFISTRRGSGATVLPKERVSLGALHHLLFIDGEPQEDLIQQLTRVHRILFYGSIEIAVEQSSESELERLIELVESIADIFDPNKNTKTKQVPELHMVLYEFFGLVVFGSRNLVLRMIYQAMDPVILSDLGKYREGKKIYFKKPVRETMEIIAEKLKARDGKGVEPLVKALMEENMVVQDKVSKK